MSEYHAAVGLAALDGWDAKKTALQGVVSGYRKRMESAKLANGYVGAPGIKARAM